MDYRQIVAVSFESLLAHKFRSFLTMLGIIFGVAAVIAMLSIGEGAKQDALEQIDLLGVRNIIVEGTIPPETKGSESVGGRSPGLTLADAENLDRFSSVFSRVVSCQINDNMKIFQADMETDAAVIGTTPAYLDAMNFNMREGKFLRDEDIADYSQVCVIGPAAKRALFGFDDAVGNMIRIQDSYYRVIGVMAEKVTATASIGGTEIRDVNNNIYIPLSTALSKIHRDLDFAMSRSGRGDEARLQYNIDQIDQIIIQVREGKDIPQAAALVKRVMERRHRNIPDFNVIVPAALLAQKQKTQQIFNIVMGAIAGISLLVGGIGIMNIMLASVLERTREIGVRRAVGASRLAIMSQFLVESVIICLVGCVVGVLSGLGLALAISTYADWRTIISIFSIVLAVGVSTAVGIVFGFFPARKAAYLNVIEALRYE